MKRQHIVLSATALAVSLALGACGGGGGSSTGTTSGATTTVRGLITGFGSVFVNGVEYDLDTSTSVTLDGASGSESGLQVGMLVTLVGSVNADGLTGLASAITYADVMEGVVTANAVAANGVGTLTVMGQTVNVSTDTIFASNVGGVTSADLIAVGNVVEVSGYASSTGTVTATRIEVKSATQTGEIEVKGTISGLTSSTFSLGALTVDYSGIAAADLPSGLADGAFVEVKSTTSFNGSGSLMASQVELSDDGLSGHEGAEGESLEIKGLVTAAYDAGTGTVEVNGVTATIDSDTEFSDGDDTSSLTAGTKVSVESHYDANGALVIDSIEIDDSESATGGSLEFGGSVEAVDATAKTITVMGQTFYVDNNTVMLDESSDDVRYFDLADITASSDFVEIHAYLDSASGHLIATQLKRDDASGSSTIKGEVTAITGSVATVGDVSIDFSGVGSPPVIIVGDIVEAEGSFSSGTLTATDISKD